MQRSFHKVFGIFSLQSIHYGIRATFRTAPPGEPFLLGTGRVPATYCTFKTEQWTKHFGRATKEPANSGLKKPEHPTGGQGSESLLRSLRSVFRFASFIPLRSSPRLISTGQLNVLPRLHFRPINQVVFLEPYLFRVRDLILRRVSRLDAFSVYLVRT